VPAAVAACALLASCSTWLDHGQSPNPPPRAVARAPSEPTRAIPIVQTPAPSQRTKPAVAALPPARPVAKPNMLDPRILVGLDQVSIEDLIGKPLDIRQEPPATVWRYQGEDCTLAVFFYLDIGSHKLRALAYDIQPVGDVSPAGGATTPPQPGSAENAKLCVGQIQAENRVKQR